MVLALAFTVVTPVEVAFYSEGLYITPMWVVNRIVDFCFIIDIVLTFNLAFQERPERRRAMGIQQEGHRSQLPHWLVRGRLPVGFAVLASHPR